MALPTVMQKLPEYVSLKGKIALESLAAIDDVGKTSKFHFSMNAFYRN